MRRWGIGTNDLYYTASATLEEAPWYVFAAEWLNWNVCSWIPPIPFPAIKFTPKNDDDCPTTLKDYYGDLRGFWCCNVCHPASQYLFSKIAFKSIELPYKVAEKDFPEEIENIWDSSTEDEEDTLEREAYRKQSFMIADRISDLYDRLPGYKKPTKHI